jgi:hypothetical protein
VGRRTEREGGCDGELAVGMVLEEDTADATRRVQISEISKDVAVPGGHIKVRHKEKRREGEGAIFRSLFLSVSQLIHHKRLNRQSTVIR